MKYKNIKEISKLTNLDVNTESKQANILNELSNTLASVTNEQNNKLSAQTIANDLGLILETKTTISDELLTGFHKYHVHSIAVLYGKVWKRTRYNDNNIKNIYTVSSLKKLIHFCNKHYINLNDYWVIVNNNGYVSPINVNTIKSIINFVVLA